MASEVCGMGMRYITYQGKQEDCILMFPDSMEHAQVLRLMNIDMHTVHGAGYVNLQTLTCYGGSVSIDADSTERCTRILRANSRS